MRPANARILMIENEYATKIVQRFGILWTAIKRPWCPGSHWSPVSNYQRKGGSHEEVLLAMLSAKFTNVGRQIRATHFSPE